MKPAVENVIMILIVAACAIVLNITDVKFIDNICFTIPGLIGGIGLWGCLQMKHNDKSQKLYSIFWVALFIVFLVVIAPTNNIPVATFLYNHLGAVIIVGIILIGLVFYIDSERNKSYWRGWHDAKEDNSDQNRW